MKIYKDLISGDEFFSDTYPIELVDGVVYKVKGKSTTENTGIDEKTLGANPSAEGGDEGGADDSSVSGIDIIIANRLVETFFGKKKEYQDYIKVFMKNVKERLEKESPEEVPAFLKGASKFVKEVLGDFSEYQFYMGEKADADGLIGLLKWDEETPYMYFFKHCLEEEKV